jgi:dTDP-4-dehydrorhamnose 3,5-epimerase
VLRGLHYQKSPKAQGKLVICMKGRIFDVAVDIRKSSSHYGRWTGVELTGENRLMLYVPPGFAHGFQVISDTAEVMYKCTDEYSLPDDRGIIWNDPDINIAWPLTDPVLSCRTSCIRSCGMLIIILRSDSLPDKRRFICRLRRFRKF